MQREKEIPSKPRFEYVNRKAYELLLELGYNKFPISEWCLLDDLSDFIEYLPWSKAKAILQCDDPFFLKRNNADARVIKKRGTSIYLIVYNDDTSFSKGRIKWTLMHEIGHVILGHLDDFGETALNRGGLNKEEYGILEVEANWFAQEFLMPTPLLKYQDKYSISEIMALFAITEDAARKEYHHLYELPQYSSRFDDPIMRNFYSFMLHDELNTIYHQLYADFGATNHSDLNGLYQKCPSCYVVVKDSDARYCGNCGCSLSIFSENASLFAQRKIRRELARKVGTPLISFPQIKTAELNQPWFCPVCMNDEVSVESKYCHICGSSVYNECVDEHRTLPVNLSYCPYCGAKAAMKSANDALKSKLAKLNSAAKNVSDDWIEFDKWEYICYKLCSNISRAASSLYYTKAFVDDDDCLVIITNTESGLAEIEEYRLDIIKGMERYGGFIPDDVRVCLI